MSRYRKVDPRVWNDEKFRDLNDQGKLLFFFLLTHPHMTAIGAMRASLPGLAAEIGWTDKALREAFLDVSSKGMAMHDEKASFIWLPKFIKYNPPESPNVVKAWINALEMLPECSLLTRAITESVAFAKGMNKGFAEALPEAFSKTMPIQEQEQEQEHEQEQYKNKASEKIDVIDIPDWIPKDAWSAYVQMRKKIKKPMTDEAVALAIKKLNELSSLGHKPIDVLEQSIFNSWQGLFEIKKPSTNGYESAKDKSRRTAYASLTGSKPEREPIDITPLANSVGGTLV